MKTMLLTDLVVIKRQMGGMAIAYLVIALVIGGGIESLAAMAACFCAMVPMVLCITLLAYDEYRGWELFRATLPVRRSDMVLGRFSCLILLSLVTFVVSLALAFAVGGLSYVVPLDASFIPAFQSEFAAVTPIIQAATLGACFILVVNAIVLPVFFKFGMTKGTRFLPLLICAAVLMAMAAGQFFNEGSIEQLFMWMSDNLVLTYALCVVITVAALAASAIISIKVYQQKEL